jgi:hypothetical protein
MYVDVIDNAGRIIHTYPIHLSGMNFTPSEQQYFNQARENAIADKLVPKEELELLKFRCRPKQ